MESQAGPKESEAQTSAATLTCLECGARWRPDDPWRWKAYVSAQRPPEILVYCGRCAEREFGG